MTRWLLLSISPSMMMSSPGKYPVFCMVNTASMAPPHSRMHLPIRRRLRLIVTGFCSCASSRISSLRSTRKGSLEIVVPSPISCRNTGPQHHPIQSRRRYCMSAPLAPYVCTSYTSTARICSSPYDDSKTTMRACCIYSVICGVWQSALDPYEY